MQEMKNKSVASMNPLTLEPLTSARLNGEEFIAVSAPTFQAIHARFGSFRRTIEAYWIGDLSPAEESVIEDKVPKDTLRDYRPVGGRITE